MRRLFTGLLLAVFLSTSASATTVIDLDGIINFIEAVDTIINFPGTNSLSPSSKKKLDKEKETKIVINSNVSNADVYLNGVYKGKSSLTLKNLREGKYKLELRKDFYQCDVYTISVKAGYELTYDVYMKEIQGTLNFKGIPSDAVVYVDSSRIWTTLLDIIAGYHDVKVTRFGYETYKERIYLEPYRTYIIQPAFREIPFAISDFKASRETINPKIKGAMGKSEISFEVTNKGNGRLSVFAPDGRLTNSYDFPEFKTWNQSYVWNGCDDKGNVLEDGTYWFELESEGENFETCVTINTGLTYPVMNTTPSGLGYGSAPAVEPFSLGFGLLNFYGVPVFHDGKYVTTAMDAGLAGAFNEYLSMGIAFRTYAAESEKMPYVLSGNIRIGNQAALNDVTLSFAGLIKYGYASGALEVPGTDYGAGFGAGLLLGLASEKTSVTASMQYVMGSETGNIKEGNNLVLAGLAFAFKPALTVSLYGDLLYSVNKGLVTFGGGLNWLPFGYGVMLNAGAEGVYDFGQTVSDYRIKAGLTLLF